MKALMVQFATDLNEQVDWSATSAMDCLLLGLNTPHIDEYNLSHLRDAKYLTDEHKEILRGLIYDHRKAQGIAKRESEMVVGHHNFGGLKAPVIDFGKLAPTDIMKHRTVFLKL